jgi:archaellum biogenesis ATPase FlaH
MNALDPFACREVWVSWAIVKRGGRPTKVPFSVDGKPAKADDSSTWMTRAQAVKAARQNQHQGIGIMFAALDDGQHLGGIDLDACIDDDGAVVPWAREILDLAPSYTEISPSGRGLKIYFLHDPRETLAAAEHWRRGVRRRAMNGGKDHGIEMYLERRYFAVTGRTFEDLDTMTMLTLDRLQAVHEKMEAFQPRPKPKPRPASDHPRRHDSDAARLLDAIDHIPNPDLHWEEFNKIGMAIYAATGGSVEGHAAFEHFSARSSLHEAAATEERWNNYRRSPPKQLSAGTIFHEARLAGWREPERPKGNGHGELPPPSSEEDYGTPSAPPGEAASSRDWGSRRVENKLYREIMREPDDPPAPLVAELVPAEVVGVFIGSGGAGKGITLQTLCTCVASGTAPFFGYAVQQGLSIFWTAEDRKRQLLNRQRRICSALGIEPEVVADHLVLTSYREPDCILWKQGRPTSILMDLLDDAERLKAKLLVIDSASITYGDDEIKRLEVASYLRYLDLYAEKLGCTIIVILHTSRSSDESVERLSSGSTAWVFQGRFALLLRKDKDDDDISSLVVAKINYGRPGLKIDLQWTDDGILTHVPAKDTVDNIRDHADDGKLLSIIDIRWNKADAEPFRKNSGATLRSVMAKEPLNWKTKRTEKCIARLELAGWVGYREGGGKRGWYVTEDGKKQIT